MFNVFNVANLVEPLIRTGVIINRREFEFSARFARSRKKLPKSYGGWKGGASTNPSG
jgi:hypothetical protein